MIVEHVKFAGQEVERSDLCFNKRKGPNGETFVRLRTAMGPSEEFCVDDLVGEMDYQQLRHLREEVSAQIRKSSGGSWQVMLKNPYVMPGAECVPKAPAAFPKKMIFRSRRKAIPDADAECAPKVDFTMSFPAVNSTDLKTQVSAQIADECPCGGSHEAVEMIFSSFCKKCNCTLT